MCNHLLVLGPDPGSRQPCFVQRQGLCWFSSKYVESRELFEIIRNENARKRHRVYIALDPI